MATTLPCPNPTCTHQFSLTELQSAVQVLCPKCGFRMQGRASAAAAKPVVASPKVAAAPKVAVAQPVSAPPPKGAVTTPMPASPKPAAPPLAMPIAAAPATPAPPVNSEGSAADGAFFNPPLPAEAGTLVRAGKPKRKFRWIRALVLVLAIGFAASIVVVAVIGMLWFFLGTEGLGSLNAGAKGSVYVGQIRGAKDGNEKIYKLVLAKDEWEIDQDVKSRFEAHAAWKLKQKDQEFWFAIVVKDYGVFKPRDAEMLRYGIDKLEACFGDALELAAKAEPAKVASLAAQKIQFKGQIKSANWLGECYMFFNNGVGYWLFVASPDWPTVEFFAAELPKKHFFVESERRAWREQPPPTETFASKDGKISVTAPKDVWEKHPNPKDLDENGALLLSGKYLKKKDNRKNSSILVLAFEKKTDLTTALTTAREYLNGKAKNENENYKIALATDVVPGQTEQGATEDIGNRRGRTIDLKRLFNDEIQRYYLLAVVNEPDVTYAILCDCSWDSRQTWRQDFIDILRTAKFSKGE